jgi:hypothetical protein
MAETIAPFGRFHTLHDSLQIDHDLLQFSIQFAKFVFAFGRKHQTSGILTWLANVNFAPACEKINM